MARNTYGEDEVLETPFDFKHLLRASVYIRKYANRMTLALLLSVIAAATGLLSPMIIQRALDVTIPAGDKRGLVMLGVILIATYAVSILFSTIRSRIMNIVG